MWISIGFSGLDSAGLGALIGLTAWNSPADCCAIFPRDETAINSFSPASSDACFRACIRPSYAGSCARLRFLG